MPLAQSRTLGMMSAIQDTVELCRQRGAGREFDLHNIPQDDPACYEMMQKADTIGVFQIESRAQQSTLPRMKPEVFYDLVVEVATTRLAATPDDPQALAALLQAHLRQGVCDQATDAARRLDEIGAAIGNTTQTLRLLEGNYATLRAEEPLA